MRTDLILGTLYSGSRGNAALVRYKDTAILVDAGRSTRYLTGALAEAGLSPDQIDAIFLTHSHTDHIAALKVWSAKYRTPIHATGAVCRAVERYCPGCVISHPILFSEKIGDISVRSFPTEHDSPGSVGYRFTVSDGSAETSVGVATDLGVLTDHVKGGLVGCRAAVIESNHDVEMLMCGPYPPDTKQRILSRYGHLSNESGAALALFLAERGTEKLLLAHISENNNTPALALGCTEKALRGAGMDTEIAVAMPAAPVLFTLQIEETT